MVVGLGKKIWFFGACFIVLSEASPGYPDSLQNLEYGPPGAGNGGRGSGGYDDGKHEPANYDFQYEVFGGGNFFGHEESRRDQKTKGKYHVLLPDGRRQTVDYIADETGYHPTITYELIGSGNEGGYANGGSSGGGNSAAYGAPQKAPSSGYGAPQQSPSSDYGAPQQAPGNSYGPPSDNALGGYRSKRQHSFQNQNQNDQFDLVRVYRGQDNNSQQRFRNRRRRYSSPRKVYLIVHPDQ